MYKLISKNSRSSAPTVSVGMPVFNSEKWISQSIDSILSQTYTNFELIIADNNSEDNTIEICNKFASQDKRIHIYKNNENIGAAKNFNKAFELSSGKYFKWASSNDLCAHTLLEKCTEILESREDVSLVVPKTQLIDNDGNVIDLCDEDMHLMDDISFDRFNKFLERIRLNNAEQGLIRSKILKETNLQSVYPNSDTVLMAEIAARGKVFQIQEYLLSRRQSSSSTTKFMTDNEVSKFYSPKKNYISHPTLRTFFEYFLLTFKLPVDLREKMKFLYYSLRYLYWNKKSLASDFHEQWNNFIRFYHTKNL